MPDQAPPPLVPYAEDLIFSRESLGIVLRDLRDAQAVSLRELERRSGVTASEIQKVEAGQQDCRLPSFVLICAALGLPPGSVLDDVLLPNVGLFSEAISADSSVPQICQEMRIPLAERRNIPMVLAHFCSAAAYFLRCASPARAVSFLRYPSASVKEQFTNFAERLANKEDGQERLSALHRLIGSPIAELRRTGLFPDEYLRRYVEFCEMAPGERRGRTLMWTPLIYPRGIERMIRRREMASAASAESGLDPSEDSIEKSLTHITRERNSPAVRSELQNLVARVKSACLPEGSGKRAELARFLGVPMPRVSEWLSGQVAPGGETTLHLLAWVTAEEAKPKSSGRAQTLPEPKTQTRKASKHETNKSGRKQK